MAVTFQFNADSKQAIREIEKLVAENAKLRDEVKKTAAESKKAAKEHTDNSGKGLGELKAMVAGYFTVGAAVGFVTRSYGDWRREMEKLGQEHLKFTNNLVKELAQAGDLAEGGRISARISSFQATRQQSLDVLAGIREGTPATDLSRRLDLGEAAAPLAATGIDMKQLGTAVGEFQDFAPKKEAGDIVDLVAKAQTRAGGDFAEMFSPATLRGIGTLIESKAVANVEEGLGLALAAADANVSAKLLPSLAEAVGADKAKLKGVTGAGDFIKASPKERLRQLLEGGAVADKLLGNQEKFAGLIPEEAIRARTEELREAQTGDFRFGQVEALSGFEEGRLQAQSQEAAIELERARQIRARVSAASENVKQEMERRLEETDAGWLTRSTVRGLSWVAQGFAEDAVTSQLKERANQNGGLAAGFGQVVSELRDIKNRQRRVVVEGNTE